MVLSATCTQPSHVATPDVVADTGSTASRLLLLCRECLDKRWLVLGEEHTDTLMSLNNLSALMYKLSRYAEAEELNR